MSDESGRHKSVAASPIFSLNLRPTLVLIATLLSVSCGLSSERRVIPPEVESTIASLRRHRSGALREGLFGSFRPVAARRDLEQSVATFKTLRTKLGEVENRMLQSAKEQENSSGPLQGRAFIISYRTKFQHGEGMETFTLLQRNGRWQLASYFVNSTALQ